MNNQSNDQQYHGNRHAAIHEDIWLSAGRAKKEHIPSLEEVDMKIRASSLELHEDIYLKSQRESEKERMNKRQHF